MSIGLDDLLIGGDALGDLGVLHDSVLGLGDLALSLVESLSLDLPLSLQSGNNVLVLPADLNINSVMNCTLTFPAKL